MGSTPVILQPHSMLAATAARDLKVDRLSHSDVGPKLATNAYDAAANDLSMLESKHVVYCYQLLDAVVGLMVSVLSMQITALGDATRAEIQQGIYLPPTKFAPCHEP